MIDPRVFLGRAEVSGTVIDVRRAHDAHEIWADGVLADRVDADKDFAVTEPGLRYRWNENDYEEIFAASDEGTAALAGFLDVSEASPPVGPRLGAARGRADRCPLRPTPRGRRALAR